MSWVKSSVSCFKRKIYTKMFQINVVSIQVRIPQTVGMRKETMDHFKLPVSFFIVSNVVPHGKCIKVKSITLIAVSMFQPFCIKMVPMWEAYSKFTKVPVAM